MSEETSVNLIDYSKNNTRKFLLFFMELGGNIFYNKRKYFIMSICMSYSNEVPCYYLDYQITPYGYETVYYVKRTLQINSGHGNEFLGHRNTGVIR